jgi:hypothetical protein
VREKGDEESIREERGKSKKAGKNYIMRSFIV